MSAPDACPAPGSAHRCAQRPATRLGRVFVHPRHEPLERVTVGAHGDEDVLAPGSYARPASCMSQPSRSR